MTRKDYVRAIELMKGKSVEDYSTIANFLIEFFGDDNSRFNAEKFAKETIKVCINSQQYRGWLTNAEQILLNHSGFKA